MSDIMLSEFFNGSEIVDMNLTGGMMSPPELDYSSLFDSFNAHEFHGGPIPLPSQKSTVPSYLSPFEVEPYNNIGHDDHHHQVEVVKVSSKKCKKQKTAAMSTTTSTDEVNADDGHNKNVSHITVERNRRKQMNEHLSVLRSLMPCFYAKRGDQASIIGGVVEYINELQQVLQSLESKKQRKLVYNEVLSPRSLASARTLGPNKPPLSPRLMNLPISPKTPLQPISPHKCPRLDNNVVNGNGSEIVVATSNSSTADVEVKFSGPNLVLKTVSKTRHGQSLKIISTLEDLALEVLNVNISRNSIDDTMIISFTIKIGIECKLSAEELAYQIQQTFC